MSSASRPEEEEIQYAWLHDNSADETVPSNVLGIFFDGTGNDRSLDTPTSVEFLRRRYMCSSIYVIGVGTTGDSNERRRGQAQGYGIKTRIEATKKVLLEYRQKIGVTDAQELIVDLIGFSRGAATARAFSNVLLKLNEKYTIRFLGIFDTVAQVDTPTIFTLIKKDSTLGSVLGAFQSFKFNDFDYKITDNVGYCAHAVAGNENRVFFPLTSIFAVGAYQKDEIHISEYLDMWNDVAHEKVFWGAHSDIGGGYPEGGNPEAFLWMLTKMREQKVLVDDVTNPQTNRCAIHNSQFWLLDFVKKDSWKETVVKELIIDEGYEKRIVLDGNLIPKVQTKPEYNIEHAHTYKVRMRRLANVDICLDPLISGFATNDALKKLQKKQNLDDSRIITLQERIISLRERIQQLERWKMEWPMSGDQIVKELKDIKKSMEVTQMETEQSFEMRLEQLRMELGSLEEKVENNTTHINRFHFNQ